MKLFGVLGALVFALLVVTSPLVAMPIVASGGGYTAYSWTDDMKIIVTAYANAHGADTLVFDNKNGEFRDGSARLIALYSGPSATAPAGQPCGPIDDEPCRIAIERDSDGNVSLWVGP